MKELVLYGLQYSALSRALVLYSRTFHTTSRCDMQSLECQGSTPPAEVGLGRRLGLAAEGGQVSNGAKLKTERPRRIPFIRPNLQSFEAWLSKEKWLDLMPCAPAACFF